MKQLSLISFMLWLLFAGVRSQAQTTRRVLFLGNSYTGTNNLPQLLRDVALSAGDTLIIDSNTPGGYTLQDHWLNTVTNNKVMAGNWDYVVLQGQSREPILSTPSFNSGGYQLNTLVKQYNPCAVTMLYMTWGRKNGDAAFCPGFPEMCTYTSMDSALKYCYLNLATSLNAEVSPVSVVWRNLRQNNPGINLYRADESHPSAAGSYAAACSFYASIFKKDPTLASYNFTLNATDAAIIRSAAKAEVYDSLSLWDYKRMPVSDFQYKITQVSNEVIFTPITYGTQQNYHWDFGDGNTSTMISPTHTYAANGTYTVTLTTTNCNLQGTNTSITDTMIQFCSHTPDINTVRPWLCQYDTLWTQAADAYQWYAAGAAIPETLQYLTNYQRYNGLTFSVMSTLNGCSELSEEYHAKPQRPGYFFDAAWRGDPCKGDTALFVVLHVNGFLKGSEIIYWYRNGTRITSANNDDTLRIISQGVYECKVVDTTSMCPLDTTFMQVTFDCGSLAIAHSPSESLWRLYPNPASDILSIEINGEMTQDEILIYSTNGRVIKTLRATPHMKIDVSTLPAGLYFIRCRNNREAIQKFIKE